MSRPLIAVIGDRSIPRVEIPVVCWRPNWGEHSSRRAMRYLTGGVRESCPTRRHRGSNLRKVQGRSLGGGPPGIDPAPASDFADTVLATGLDHARNLIASNSDAVVAIGGGAGTLSEMAFAWALHRLMIAYRVHGWSGTLAGTRINGPGSLSGRFRETRSMAWTTLQA